MKSVSSRRCAIIAGLLFATSVLATDVAFAAGCIPSKPINKISLIGREGGAQIIVPVRLNDVQKFMLLDTGAGVTQIMPAVADELKLPVLNSHIRVYGMDGAASDKRARLMTFTVGYMQAKDVHLQISPATEAPNSRGYDGILSTDILGQYALDLNFREGVLTIYDSDRCDGPVTWSAPATAILPINLLNANVSDANANDDLQTRSPFSAPSGQNRYSRLNSIVSLDGHALSADLDSGTSISAMSLDVAKRVFGIGLPAPDAKNTVPSGQSSLYLAKFSTLDLNGVMLRNVKIAIVPDSLLRRDKNAGLQTGSHVRRTDDEEARPDLVIGMDILRYMHVYLSIKDKRLYATVPNVSADNGVPLPALLPLGTGPQAD